MIKPSNPYVNIYILDGKVKAMIQLDLEGLQIPRTQYGSMVDEDRKRIQAAMEEALAKWEIDET